MPSEGRAGAPARPLLFLSGFDALVLLVAVGLNLEPLLRFDGLITVLLIWTAILLISASAAAFAGAIWLGKPTSSRTVVTVFAISNGVLVAVVALYYTMQVRLSGWRGCIFMRLRRRGLLRA